MVFRTILMYISGEWLWKAGEWDVKAECIIPIEVVHSWPIEEQERFMALAYQVLIKSPNQSYRSID